MLHDTISFKTCIYHSDVFYLLIFIHDSVQSPDILILYYEYKRPMEERSTGKKFLKKDFPIFVM